MRQACWMVESYKGDSLFLEQPNAMAYAAKYGGIIVKMVRFYVEEAPSACDDIRQAREIVVSRGEQLPKESSCPSEGCAGCGTAGESFSACGGSGNSETERLVQGFQDFNNSLQRSRTSS